MFGGPFEKGDRVWVDLTDIGPSDMRKGTVIGHNRDVDKDGLYHRPVTVLLDGADEPTEWYRFRVEPLNPLELLAEVTQ
jgi:hypothetical protein